MSSTEIRTFPLTVTRLLRHVPAADFSSLPNTPGAYMITVPSGERYVGSSKTLRSRVIAHREPKDPNLRGAAMVSACTYLTETHVDARILEGFLIREVRPELNHSPTLRPGDIASRCESCAEGWGPPGCNLDITVRIERSTPELPADEVSRLPPAPGAYVITTASGSRYVGSSKRLCRRAPAPHDNVTGEIQSIRCHETAHEEDALILEYGLIRELNPQLNREFQPDASTWKDGSGTDGSGPVFLSKSSPELRALFRALSARIRGIDDDIREVARKKWVTFQLSAMKNFCAVTALKSSLKIDLKVDEHRFEDSAELSKRIEPTQAWNFHRRIVVKDLRQVEAALPLIRQAFETI